MNNSYKARGSRSHTVMRAQAASLLAVLSLLTGCQAQPHPGGVTPSWSFTVTNDVFPPHTPLPPGSPFTCAGITQAQLESILRPGDYDVNLHPCSVNGASPGYAVYIWGVEPDRSWSYLSVDISYFEPFMFYHFPSDIGIGGVWWHLPDTGPYYNVVTAITDQAVTSGYPVVGLELYHSEDNGQVVSRGITVLPNFVIDSGWPKHAAFTVDPILALTRLALWSAQGLHAQFPDLFPNPVPDVKTVPYVPPPDGGYRSAPGTPTPSGSPYITPPPRYTPPPTQPTAATGGPAPTPTG